MCKHYANIYRADRDYDRIGPNPGGTTRSRIAALPVLPGGLHRAPSSSTPVPSRGMFVIPLYILIPDPYLLTPILYHPYPPASYPLTAYSLSPDPLSPHP
jgi:hypothetical protein